MTRTNTHPDETGTESGNADHLPSTWELDRELGVEKTTHQYAWALLCILASADILTTVVALRTGLAYEVVPLTALIIQDAGSWTAIPLDLGILAAWYVSLKVAFLATWKVGSARSARYTRIFVHIGGAIGMAVIVLMNIGVLMEIGVMG